MSLIEAFKNNVIKNPDDVAYYFLSDGESKVLSITYSELEKKVFFLADKLRQNHQKGSRIIVLFDTSIDFMISFWSCLFAEMIAVPVNPPIDFRQLQRLLTIVKDASPSVLLTNSEILGKMAVFQGFMKDLPEMERIALDKLDYKTIENNNYPDITPDTDALIQYTSGSVGLSKGVLITHNNLFHNALMQKTIMDKSPSPTGIKESFGCWLPLYHDMGLMSGTVLPIVLNTFSVIMSPLMFLQKPYRWLKALSDYKVTVSAAPNFAYELVLKRVTDEQIEKLDLSNWCSALNGAEAVRAETIDKFVSRFSGVGFKKEYFFPAYGLAESTVFCTGGERFEEPKLIKLDRDKLQDNQVIESKSDHAVTIVGVGHSWLDEELVIANHETSEKLPELQIGEIWLNSQSIAKKYWNNEDETKEIFQAKVKSSDKDFMRTGDLGFIKDNELYIVGRIKDLIIIKGKNYQPYHIEQTAEKADSSFRLGSCAAFSVDVDNEEKLVVVQEVKNEAEKNRRDEMIENLKTSVLETHGVPVYDALLIKAGTIFKTSSGKIQRRLCKKKYLSKGFDLWK